MSIQNSLHDFISFHMLPLTPLTGLAMWTKKILSSLGPQICMVECEWGVVHSSGLKIQSRSTKHKHHVHHNGHNHWSWSLSKTYSDLLKMYIVTKGFNINSFFKFHFLDLFVALSEMDIRFLQQPPISLLLCSREWLGSKEILLSMPVFLLLGSAWIHPVHR